MVPAPLLPRLGGFGGHSQRVRPPTPEPPAPTLPDWLPAWRALATHACLRATPGGDQRSLANFVSETKTWPDPEFGTQRLLFRTLNSICKPVVEFNIHETLSLGGESTTL